MIRLAAACLALTCVLSGCRCFQGNFCSIPAGMVEVAEEPSFARIRGVAYIRCIPCGDMVPIVFDCSEEELPGVLKTLNSYARGHGWAPGVGGDTMLCPACQKRGHITEGKKGDDDDA